MKSYPRKHAGSLSTGTFTFLAAMGCIAIALFGLFCLFVWGLMRHEWLVALVITFLVAVGIIEAYRALDLTIDFKALRDSLAAKADPFKTVAYIVVPIAFVCVLAAIYVAGKGTYICGKLLWDNARNAFRYFFSRYQGDETAA